MLTRRPSDRRSVPFGNVFDWLLDDPWSDFGRRPHDGAAPAIDIRETDDALTIEAELPGIKPDDIDVTIDGRTLAIRAKTTKEQERKDESGRYLVRERRATNYFRVIMLPLEVDTESVQSTFEDGELKVTLPKAVNRRSRRIPVKGTSTSVVAVGPGNGKHEANQSEMDSTSAPEPVTAGSGSPQR
jgi:HSP20 family protein